AAIECRCDWLHYEASVAVLDRSTATRCAVRMKKAAPDAAFARFPSVAHGYQLTSFSAVDEILWILRSAPMNSCSASRRKPITAFNMPYMTSAPSTATAIPPSEPASCASRFTPPSPPKAFSPKMPAAIPPHAPQSPCNGHTPRTSSIFQRFCVTVNMKTNKNPAINPVASPPRGCMRSDPAQIATSPASGPLWTKPGSLRPAIRAPMVPPAIAINEFTATRPLILSMDCADMTLKPNQPTVRIHAPSARNGMLEGGCAAIPPSLL